MNRSETRQLIFQTTLTGWCMLFACNQATPADVKWAGDGAYRVFVKVAPNELTGRQQDEMPAEVELKWDEILRKTGQTGSVDISTIQVIRYDPRTGNPLKKGSRFEHGKGEFDAPFRWYDGSIPYEFPEFADAISRTKGKLRRTPIVRGGYFYNAVGDWKQGKLAWLHNQEGNQPSHYAIYFDLLPVGKFPQTVPPRAWIGDGTPRCDLVGTTTFGSDHARIDLDDWNDDGLVDILFGEAYGHVFWCPNRGTKTEPKFPYAKFVFDTDGVPLDAGTSAAPKIVDWNGDGVKDMLVGADWNRILIYLNEGTNQQRRFKYAGLLKADGELLTLPITPLARGNAKIFKRDYYPVLETVDWDGDGDIDLLAGGYITGRIFLYENRGRDESSSLPKLAFRGPLNADGKPLNVVHWCASPCVADFDGDGDFDLMSGSMPIGTSGGDSAKDGLFLRYYENVGTRRSPKLTERPFPMSGTFPRRALATPRAADWDNDGDLDLFVSSRESLFQYENVGSPGSPKFAIHDHRIAMKWGSSRIPGDQFLDYNHDGLPDLFSQAHFDLQLNSGKGNPWYWKETISFLPKGATISHPSGIGDDWSWPYLTDFDGDGRMDILFGDWFGHIWFHKNRSTDKQRDFDLVGKKLMLASGKPLKVGPIQESVDESFTALQGARTVFATADFDRDGHDDLVVGDTFGIVRFFRNRGGAAPSSFDEPQQFGNLGIRLLVDVTDWNQDGWQDVIAGAANGRVRVFLNRKNQKGAQFAEGFDPQLPPIPQPRVLMSDINADGDDDLLLPSTIGSFFIERSFLQHGYAQGELLRVESKSGQRN